MSRLLPLLIVVFSLPLSGCFTVYQPLHALQRPVVLDPSMPNFEGLRMLIRCIPSSDLPANDAQRLCRNVQTLFTNQGAQVEVDIPRPGVSGAADEGLAKPEMVIELKTRVLHRDASTPLYCLSFLTFTLIPAMSEYTFAQDVVILDRNGFQLTSDSLQGRFIRYLGFGLWAVNKTVDVTSRKGADKVTGNAAQRDFSRDFHGQLSQLAFNAHIRSQVMRGFEERPVPPVARPEDARLLPKP